MRSLNNKTTLILDHRHRLNREVSSRSAIDVFLLARDNGDSPHYSHIIIVSWFFVKL